MNIRIAVAGIAVSLTLVSTAPLLGHSGATGVVKARMEAMKALAGEMKQLAAMIKGAAPFDGNAAADAGKRIAGHADMLATLFPEGSLRGPSEASLDIWKERDRFDGIMKTLSTEGRKLESRARSAKGADEIRSGFGAVAATCKACHQDYRIKSQ